jgi:hypothetical protein
MLKLQGITSKVLHHCRGHMISILSSSLSVICRIYNPFHTKFHIPWCSYYCQSEICINISKGGNIDIVTCKGLAWLITKGTGFDDWVYWHFFTITVDYNSSHIELLLNNVCLANASEQSLTSIWISHFSLLLESTNPLPSITSKRSELKSPPPRFPLLCFTNALSRKPCIHLGRCFDSSKRVRCRETCFKNPFFSNWLLCHNILHSRQNWGNKTGIFYVSLHTSSLFGASITPISKVRALAFLL